jgi:probable rRNA maturation factor
MADEGGRLRVGVCDEGGRPVGARGLASWLLRVAPARARGHVNIAIVSDARVRRLNRAYLRHDYATDVLSCPSSEGARRRPPAANRTARIGPQASRRFLGDIVIARGVAERQARRAGHAASTELRVLALHGLLHLLGYDHERDEGRMRRLEERLRKKGGLGEGLIGRQT